MLRQVTCLSLLTVMCLQTSCRGKDEREESSYEGANSVVQDETLSTGAVEANVVDSISAMADSNGGASTTSLMLADVNHDQEKSRTCTAIDDHQVQVDINRTLDRSRTQDNERISLEHTISGHAQLKRSWESPNFDIACTNGKSVNVDWSSDISGLKVHVDIDRALSVTGTLTHKRTGRTLTVNHSMSSVGTRDVEWLTSVEDEAAGTITRTKHVSSSMNRKEEKQNSKGDKQTLDLTVETKSDAPLAITSVRDATTLALKSKTIHSGVLVAKRAGDGSMESSFTDLQLDFTGDTCALSSGKVVTAFYKEGSDTAEKTLELVIVDGVATLTNVDTGDEIADFELPGCDTADFQL